LNSPRLSSFILLLWLTDGAALALDVPYHAAFELRPLKIFNSAFENSLGAEFGAEIGLLAGNFLTISAGKSFGRAQTDMDEKSEIRCETWSAGLRTYSYYRTDSLYLGASIAGSSIELQDPIRSSPWLTETYRQVQVESGFRWLWPSGFMLRTGALVRRMVSGPDIKTHTSDSNLSLMRQQAGNVARQQNQYETSQTELALDVGLGLVF
jgi:hypothetical protein